MHPRLLFVQLLIVYLFNPSRTINVCDWDDDGIYYSAMLLPASLASYGSRELARAPQVKQRQSGIQILKLETSILFIVGHHIVGCSVAHSHHHKSRWPTAQPPGY
jgi:hypothetical protein